jgi:F-type H+-transporting ATPase subunit epsilon
MPNNLYVEIVAPDKRVFHGEVQRVRAPGVEGSFSVLRDHAPMIAAIEIGPIILTTPDGDTITMATSGGFVEVLNNVVTVLAETVEPASEIDVDRARAAEERARKRLAESTGADRERAERALVRARNRLRVAMGQVGTY